MNNVDSMSDGNEYCRAGGFAVLNRVQRRWCLSQDWKALSKLSSYLGKESYRQQSSICNGPEVGMYLACLRIARIREREKGNGKTSVR